MVRKCLGEHVMKSLLYKKSKGLFGESHFTEIVKYSYAKVLAFVVAMIVLPLVGYSSGSPFTCVQTGGTGNWNDGLTWGNSSNNVIGVDYPGPGDAVIIGNGRTITLTANASCGNLSLGAWGSEAFALGTYNLTVTGNITRTGGISITATTGYIIMAGTTQTITVTGGISIPNLRLTNSTSVTMGTQDNLTITGNFDCQTGTSTYTDNTAAYNAGSLTFASGSTCTAPNCTFTVANDHVAPALNFTNCTSPVVVGTVVLNPTGSTVLFGSNNVTTTSAFSGTNVGNISCSGTVTVGGNPTVSPSVSTLTTFSYVTGSGPSTYQTFTVSGVSLTNDVTVTAPADYDISTNSSFSNSSPLTLTRSGTIISGQPVTIYVRLKSGLSVGSYNSENIVLSSTGATNVNVACSGNVTAVPSVAISSTSQVATGNIGQNTLKNPISAFSMAVTNANTTLNSLSFTTTGTYVTADVSALKLWYGTGTISSATQLGSSVTGTTLPGTYTFSSLSASLTSGTTYNFWITADVTTTATTGHTLTVSAIATGNVLFASANESGSISAGGQQSITATAPVVTLGDNTQVTTANIQKNTTNNILARFKLDVSSANSATVTGVSFTSAGTAVTTTDLTNFKLWYASSNSFGSASQIGSSITTTLGAGSHSFTGLTQGITYSSTGYFWITADIPSGATIGNSVAVSAMTNTNITLSSGSVSGSATAAGTQTVSNVTTLYSIGGGGNWTTTNIWSTTAGGSSCTCYPQAGYSAVITSGNPITVNANSVCEALTINSGATLSGGSYTVSVTGNFTNSGTYTETSNTMSVGGNFISTGTYNTNNGTVSLNGTVVQTISNAGSFNSLTIANTTASVTAGSSLTVNGTLTTSAGAVLDMSTYQLSGNLNTISNSGTIKTSNIGSTPIPTYKTWTGTVEYAALTGGQTIASENGYTNLILDNTSGTNTASSNVTLSGSLTTTAGGTFDLGSSSIAITGSVTNGGTIKSSGNNPFPSGKTWGGTIEYSATGGGQTIASATSYTNLKIDNSSNTVTAGGNIVVNGILTTTSGGTFDLSSYTLSGTLATITNNGTIRIQNTSSTPIPSGKTWGGIIEFYNATTYLVAGIYNNITVNNSNITVSGAANVGGILNWSNNGIITTTSSNTLTITNTAVGAITNYSSSSRFISGPFSRTLPANLSASTNIYDFPVGKSSTYYPFSLTTLTTGATAPVITVEAFATTSGGSGDGTTCGSISTTEYWSASVTSGNYTTGSVSIGRQSNALTAIGRCTTVGGSYSSLAGTVGGYNISNSSLTGSTLGYFVMCKLPFFAIGSGNFSTAGTWSNTDGGSATSVAPGTGDIVTIGHGYVVTIGGTNTETIGSLTVTGSGSALAFASSAWNNTFTVTGNTYIDEGGTIAGVNNQWYYYVFNNLLIGTNTTTSATSSFNFTPSDANGCGVTISGMLSVGSCAGIGVNSPIFNYAPTLTGAAQGSNILTIANRTIYPNGTYTYGCTGGSCPTAPSTTTSVTCPVITVSTSTLSGLSYIYGSGPSTTKTYTVSGTNLVANVVITPPADYQISTNNSTWVSNPSTITLTQSGGTLNSTTIYVHLKSGLSKASYSESVSLTSTNATTRNITCSGSVNSSINAAKSTLTPTSTTITADGFSTQILTVQAKDDDGSSALTSGLTVTITKSSGTGTISSVTDNGNGTYTATVTAPSSTGNGVFVATLGGSAVQSGGSSQTQATVTYIAGPPSQIIQNTADNQSGFLGCNVATQPSVTVKDAHGNPVSGITVTFAVGSGGGTVTGATQTTNASGVATVGSWTLGTSGGTNSLFATATASTSTAPVQYPFPQSTHFHYPYGISASNPNYTRIQSLVTTWISHYYREGNLPNATPAARVQWDDTTLTVSEGMGYGMVILVYTENATNNYQAKFNKLWQYYNYYKDGNGLMNWQIQGFTGTTPGTGAATDADIDVALALLMAHKQWGSNSPDANGVTINYLARAQEMYHAIYANEVDGNYLLKPGDSWNNVQNPSYAELFAIKLAADEQTAGVLTTTDDWSTVYSTMQTYITHYRNATTGLLPNWTAPNATGSCTSSGYNAGDNKCGGTYDQGCLYGIDALRVPWRLAWDYSWYGTSSCKTTNDLMAAWLRGTSNNGPGNNPQKVKGLYNTDGSYTSECANVAGTVNGMGYIGGFAHAFMSDATQQANLDAWYEYIQDTTLAYTTTTDLYTGGTFTDYYNHTLQILYLLTVSGNTPNLYSENPVISGSPITITATAVSTVYSDNGKDLSNTSNWWTGTTATGVHPCNFSTSGTTFIVQNGHTCTLSSNIAVGAGVTMQVNGRITPTSSTILSGTGTLTGSGTVVVTRTTSSEDNFDNQYTIGTKTLSGLTVEYGGASTQYLNTTHTFDNLTINNTSGVILGADNTVTNILALTTGLLTAGSNTITAVHVSGGSATSYVATTAAYNASPAGYLKIPQISGSEITVPVGTATDYNPCYITNSGTAQDFNVRVFPGVYANGLSGPIITSPDLDKLVNRTWEITPAVQTGISAIIKLQWNASDEGTTFATNRSSAIMSKNRHTTGDNTWKSLASSSFSGSGPYLISNSAGISTFSTFGVETSSSLPIELLSFTANEYSTYTQIKWVTSTEIDNDYFSLERSVNGVDWEEVYTCKGAGTSTIKHTYSFLDYEQQSTMVYYRLKQTDFNGKATYSNILSVSPQGLKTPSIEVYPNPLDGKTLYICGLDKTYELISLYNELGVAVYSAPIALDGNLTVILDLETLLSPGTYILKCTSATQQFTKLLMVR